MTYRRLNVGEFTACMLQQFQIDAVRTLVNLRTHQFKKSFNSGIEKPLSLFFSLLYCNPFTKKPRDRGSNGERVPNFFILVFRR